MLSRVADSLYWMSRYMERTDSMLRLLKVNYASSQDHREDFSWSSVLQIFTYLKEEEIEPLKHRSRDVLCYIVTDKENENSVYNLIIKARENARSIQDNITIELWQCLNDYYHLIRQPWVEGALRNGDPISVLDSLIKQNMLYYGIVEYTMFRGSGLNFMNLGKYLERATQSTEILDMKFRDIAYDLDKTTDTTYWKYLLLSISGYALYLKSYRSGFEAKNVIDQILFNVNFPRSLSYSLYLLQQNFEQLQPSSNEEAFYKIQSMIGKLYSKVKYANVNSTLDMGLPNYLHDIHEDLNGMGKAFSQLYFAYS